MNETTTTQRVNNKSIVVTIANPESKNIVIMCHGFRSSSIGPKRKFVTLARTLADSGVASLRFDQPGSGNSEGDFAHSSFDDWIVTTTELAQQYHTEGFTVHLLGQSMGAATVIAVASELDFIASVTAWVPDPNVDEIVLHDNGFHEEGSEVVQDKFWLEAQAFKIHEKLKNVTCPAYILQCTGDAFVDEENRRAIEDSVQPHHVLETKEGWSHSSWSMSEWEQVLKSSAAFILKHRKD